MEAGQAIEVGLVCLQTRANKWRVCRAAEGKQKKKRKSKAVSSHCLEKLLQGRGRK
jgi:hypothetical protein